MDIVKTIKILLIEEELTQPQLAEKIGTSKQNLSHKFRTGNFSLKDLNKIAKALGRELKIEFIKIEEDSTK